MEEIKQILVQAKELTEEIVREAFRLKEEKEIEEQDLEKMLICTGSIFNYIDRKYAKAEGMSKEVDTMIQTLYDEKKFEETKMEAISLGIKQGKKEGIEEGIEKGKKEGFRETAKKLITLGLTVEQIKIATDLTTKEIEELRKENSN